MQWQAGASYLMNQRTAALSLTMSDSMGRPLLQALPQGQPGLTLAGSRIVIASQIPDVAPGATPIAFGNWKAAYTAVNRKAMTMLSDPYSAWFCRLFKCKARSVAHHGTDAALKPKPPARRRDKRGRASPRRRHAAGRCGQPSPQIEGGTRQRECAH
jgi:HK97 family phage major capsid protein